MPLIFQISDFYNVKIVNNILFFISEGWSYIFVQGYIYIYIYNLRFLNENFVDNILDKLNLICLHKIKWFQSIIFLVQPCISKKKSRTFSNMSLKLFTYSKSFSDES